MPLDPTVEAMFVGQLDGMLECASLPGDLRAGIANLKVSLKEARRWKPAAGDRLVNLVEKAPVEAAPTPEAVNAALKESFERLYVQTGESLEDARRLADLTMGFF